jgi:hypothetical protein
VVIVAAAESEAVAVDVVVVVGTDVVVGFSLEEPLASAAHFS